MAGALRKTMVYLGLAEEDDRYDPYDEEPHRGDRHDRAEPHRDASRPDTSRADARRDGPRETLRGDREDYREEPAPALRERAARERGAYVASVPDIDDEDEPHAEVTRLPRRTPVEEVVNDVEVTGVHRITTIHPRTYNEAKTIGESFREGTPVIMNLTDLPDGDAKRLVDFAAGLVFGLQGSIERVTNKVFLLSPADVEVTTEGGEPAKNARGLFNQS